MLQLTHQIFKPVFQFFFFFAVSLLLVSCGGSTGTDPDQNTTAQTQTLSGTAAVGAAIVGTIFVTDSNGNQVSITINQDGSYSIDVTGMAAPFIISAVPADSSQDTQYSYAVQANITVNVTPLTTLAVWLANNQLDLSALESNWQTQSSNLTTQEIADALAVVKANFSNQFSLQGLDASNYDLFSTAFNANGSGFDALLDLLTISIDMAVGDLIVNYSGINLTFDANIDTVGNNIDDNTGGNTGGATNTGLESTITVSGLGASALNNTTSSLVSESNKTIWGYSYDPFNLPPTLFILIIGLNPADVTKAITINLSAFNTENLEISEKYWWKKGTLDLTNFTSFENIPNIEGVVITDDKITINNVLLQNSIDEDDDYIFAEDIVINGTFYRN